MRSKLTPRDDFGNPRRLSGHREAIKWSLLFASRTFGRRYILPFVAGPALLFIAAPLVAGRPPFEGWTVSGTAASCGLILFFLLLFYLSASAALYLYTLLAGGVESREERKRRSGR